MVAWTRCTACYFQGGRGVFQAIDVVSCGQKLDVFEERQRVFLIDQMWQIREGAGDRESPNLFSLSSWQHVFI